MSTDRSRSPTLNESAMATGMTAPSTHSSCWRTAKRAKVRPWAPAGMLRWVIASKLGCTTAAQSPSQPARTTWAIRVGCAEATPAPTPVASSARVSSVDSGTAFRTRVTTARPTSEPRALIASANANQLSPASARRSPKASRNVAKPTVKRISADAVSPHETSTSPSGFSACRSRADWLRPPTSSRTALAGRWSRTLATVAPA